MLGAERPDATAVVWFKDAVERKSNEGRGYIVER